MLFFQQFNQWAYLLGSEIYTFAPGLWIELKVSQKFPLVRVLESLENWTFHLYQGCPFFKGFSISDPFKYMLNALFHFCHHKITEDAFPPQLKGSIEERKKFILFHADYIDREKQRIIAGMLFFSYQTFFFMNLIFILQIYM